MSMPHPCTTVGELIKSLSCLDPNAPMALIEVEQSFGWDSPGAVTTLTLKVWGDLKLNRPPQDAIEVATNGRKSLPGKQARIACTTR